MQATDTLASPATTNYSTTPSAKMLSLRSLSVLATALCASLTSAAPAPQAPPPAGGSGSFWFGAIDHTEDKAAFNSNADYQVFRDVTKMGVDSTGGTDVTARLNEILAEGGRCGGAPTGSPGGCDSSTIEPAILYFPPGTYKVSKPIEMYYYTQMIGDANDPPTILATPDFEGMAVLDADPYFEGANWFTNQNNFFRQVRNFVIDIRQVGGGVSGAGIHWQVAQATSLQNINFLMSESEGTQQQGIFMDNGSGGFMSDLTFNGGRYGAFLGSQQFTSKNMTFNNCKTAIFMNWNWGWVFHGITINGGTTGIDMGNGPDNQTVGSLILSDSKISNAENGVKFSFNKDGSNVPATGNTLFLDNVDMTGTPNAVLDRNNATILQGNQVIKSWGSGHGYNPSGKRGDTYAALKPTIDQGPINGASRPQSLVVDGKLMSRSKPQYADKSVSDFVTAKSSGLKGNGNDDDSEAMQKFLDDAAKNNKIAFFEHGAYIITKTITIPPNTKMVGSIWPLMMASGPAFSDQKKPTPVFRVGKPGDTGSVEISDFMFESKGPAPGAIMIEWNLKSQPGESGMWDAHVRIGGSAGTGLEGPDDIVDGVSLGGCRKNPNDTFVPDGPGSQCEGVFLMFHATQPSSGIYLENTWFWVADHDLDHEQPQQISIYSGRGALFENSGPAWLWGTASEHSVIYNYQFNGVGSLFGGFMQTETPYYQPNPMADQPFDFNTEYDDPLFTICKNGTAADSPPCKDAWGLRVYNSKDILIYGTGMYSFFNNYGQTCVPQQNCQENMIHIQNSRIQLYGASTKAAVNMIVDDNRGSVLDEDNRSNFCATVGYYITDH